jgi:3'(2'), 5'-bisphosphate nucleotidase
MLENELEAAIAIARKAGAKILEYYALEIIAEEKIGADNFLEPVTEADRAASRLIVAELIAAFPSDGILSEEEADEIEIRTSAKRVWIIDPIDGTKGFIYKNGDFGVQIGLADQGEAVLGVVYLPAKDTLYYAAKGSGSFVIKNGSEPKRLHVSGKTVIGDMRLAVSSSHPSTKMKEVVRALGIRKVQQNGSVGLKVGLIAEQICDLYIHLSPRTKFWDTCGPEVILKEAGGMLTNIFGNPNVYDIEDVQNHNGILATNGAAHEEVISRLRPLLKKFGRLQVYPKKKR